MRTSKTDVAHVVWNTMFCCRTVAGIVLEDFHPAQNAASHHKWAEMQRLLRKLDCRQTQQRGFAEDAPGRKSPSLAGLEPAIFGFMSDAYRLQAAVQLELVTLPAGTSLARERWMAAILSTADNAAQRRWSEDNVSDAVHTQLQRICLVLSSVPSRPLLQQRHMDNGLTARWLIDPEDGPSSRQACPKAVYVVLTARCRKIAPKFWKKGPPTELL